MSTKAELVAHLKAYGLQHFDSEAYWDWGSARLGKHAAKIDRLQQRAATDSPSAVREFMNYIAAPGIRGVVASQQTDDLARAFWEVGQKLEGRRRVLDVGCDFGMSTTWFAKLASDRDIIGIDFAGKAIAGAEATAKALGVKNARFALMDFDQRLPEGLFDAIVDIAAVQYGRNPRAVYTRIREHLTDDGVMISVPMIGDEERVQDYLQTLADAGLRVQSLEFIYARDLGRNVARPLVVASKCGEAISVDSWKVLREVRRVVGGARVTPVFEEATGAEGDS